MLYRMTSFSDDTEPERAVMVLQPGFEVITGFNGINALRWHHSRVVMGLTLRPSFHAMLRIKISGRLGNGRKVMSVTTRLVSILKTLLDIKQWRDSRLCTEGKQLGQVWKHRYDWINYCKCRNFYVWFLQHQLGRIVLQNKSPQKFHVF